MIAFAWIGNLPPAPGWANTKPTMFVRPDGEFKVFYLGRPTLNDRVTE